MKRYILAIVLLGLSLSSPCSASTNTYSSFKKTFLNEPVNPHGSYILVGNIGGTNSRFALVELYQDSFALIAILKTDSPSIISFVDTVNSVCAEFYKDYNINVYHACFAAAGPVTHNRSYCKVTNVNWDINTYALVNQTQLQSATLLNDFESIGYGVSAVPESQMTCINYGEVRPENNNQAVIGAGTGLGKCILVWNPFASYYLVAPTEGGHADFPAQNKNELALTRFVQETTGTYNPVEWEDFLSGRGLSIIYRYLKQKRNIYSPYYYKIKNSSYDPELISEYKDIDVCCKKTFEIFTRIYGRCAKNFALKS